MNKIKLFIRRNWTLLSNILWALVLLVLAIELIRDAFRAGDFVGYINAGKLVLNGEHIYSDFLNTWPPFFSVFSVPLALLDSISPYWLRFIWLAGSILALFWIARIFVRLVFNKHLLLPFQHSKDEKNMSSHELVVLVPFLIALRYMMDNLSNIQINIFLLLMLMLSIQFFYQKKTGLAALLLAFSIALKVYPIFLLLFFVFKRSWRIVLYSLLFILAFNAISFAVFGVETATEYYRHWATEIAGAPVKVHHKNQTVFAFFARLLSGEVQGIDLYINLVDWSPSRIKKISYLVIVLASIYPLILFRRMLNIQIQRKDLVQLFLVLCLCAILSPLAWKAYFIFLWPAYWIAYAMIYVSNHQLSRNKHVLLRRIFSLSVLFTVFSTELFWGSYLSDVLEVYSVITIGTILLVVALVILYQNDQDIDQLHESSLG